MNMIKNDYDKLLYLTRKVESKQATKQEKDQYIELLYKNNSITKSQYENYLSGRNNEDLLATALVIGGIILVGYLISKIN